MKQLIGDVYVYSRHSPICHRKEDASYMKCGCPKWMQWREDGHTQRRTACTRSFAGAKSAAELKTKELRGEPIMSVHGTQTIQDAIIEWLVFRGNNGLDIRRSKRVTEQLVDWFRQHEVISLHHVTTSQLMAFRNALPYKSGNSSSLNIHWSVISGFFGWAHGTGLIAKNPMPDTRIHPQFKLRFKAPEVVPPTAAQVEKVLKAIHLCPWDEETRRRVRLFILTQRWTGMAVTDTATLRRDRLGDDNRIRDSRTKTKQRFKVRIPVWLADELRALPCSDPEYFFWNRREFKNDSLSIRKYYTYKLEFLAKHAKIEITSHGFRHLFITEQLAKGWSVDDVSKMVGTTPVVIRKTYEHWIEEDDARMDAIQAEHWLEQGMDAEGNKSMVQ